MSTRIFTKQDFTLGALYRLAARRGMARADVEALMIERARLKAETARQLAGHWFTTGLFRRGAIMSSAAEAARLRKVQA